MLPEDRKASGRANSQSRPPQGRTNGIPVIDKMLRNEKYMGDALSRKTCYGGFHDKKESQEHWRSLQYYGKMTMRAIIPKELFYRVQEEMMREASLCKAAVAGKRGADIPPPMRDRHADLRKVQGRSTGSHLGETGKRKLSGDATG